jgi:hypothetical protein
VARSRTAPNSADIPFQGEVCSSALSVAMA